MRPRFAVLTLAALLIVACRESLVAPQERAPIAASTVFAAAPNSNAGGTLSEPAAYNDRICQLQFLGTPSQTAETFVIWNLGHSILDVPFNTDRPDLYAIFPGTMHTNPQHPELDHDHIVSAAPGVPGYDGTWDLWVVVAGPQFNPATYQAPRSTAAMFALIQSGVLVGPLSGSELVLRAPLVCDGQ